MLDIPVMKTQRVYRVGRVVYVPHYRKQNIYVGPGFPAHDPRMYYGGELVSMGAIEDHMDLWERPRFD